MSPGYDCIVSLNIQHPASVEVRHNVAERGVGGSTLAACKMAAEGPGDSSMEPYKISSCKRKCGG